MLALYFWYEKKCWRWHGTREVSMQAEKAPGTSLPPHPPHSPPAWFISLFSDSARPRRQDKPIFSFPSDRTDFYLSISRNCLTWLFVTHNERLHCHKSLYYNPLSGCKSLWFRWFPFFPPRIIRKIFSRNFLAPTLFHVPNSANFLLPRYLEHYVIFTRSGVEFPARNSSEFLPFFF